MWRPFGRPNRNLGTMDGNPSVVDEMNADGLGRFAGAEAVRADLARDFCSDTDRAADEENAGWDAYLDSVPHDGAGPDAPADPGLD